MNKKYILKRLCTSLSLSHFRGEKASAATIHLYLPKMTYVTAHGGLASHAH